MNIFYKINKVVIFRPKCLDISLTIDCGQAFRWEKCEDGSFFGICKNKSVKITQSEDEICFYCTREDFDSVWYDYFDLGTDYEQIISRFTEPRLRRAVEKYGGIRILHQQPWEALCSFIISQNNNIPRIKKIIRSLCENFGERDGEVCYFPQPQALCDLQPQDLAPIRAGFRAKYICDAAKKVVSGEVRLDEIERMSTDEACRELMKIKGVGPKVAQCTLLYGFARYDAFPVDVWVKRVMEKYYPDGLDESIHSVRGIAQQYLFHYIRNEEENDGE